MFLPLPTTHFPGAGPDQPEAASEKEHLNFSTVDLNKMTWGRTPAWEPGLRGFPASVTGSCTGLSETFSLWVCTYKMPGLDAMTAVVILRWGAGERGWEENQSGELLAG